MADTQLDHVGSLLQAALVADTAGSCEAYYPYRLPLGTAWGKHPSLELYRESDEFVTRGNSSQRLRQVVVRITYYAGPVAVDALSTWAGTLQDRTQVIDAALEAGKLSGWHSDEDLYTAAGIEAIRLRTVTYEPYETGGAIEGAYPAAQMTVDMLHRYVRGIESTPLAGIDAVVHQADTSEPIETEEGAVEIADQSGTNGQVVATGTLFNAATGAFTTGHVGWYIWISDASNAANNGTHEITARNSGTQVVLGGAVGLVNESSLNWALVETLH